VRKRAASERRKAAKKKAAMKEKLEGLTEDYVRSLVERDDSTLGLFQMLEQEKGTSLVDIVAQKRAAERKKE
jgi:hypothetical protein